LGKTSAIDILDDVIYTTILDCSTREFLFRVDHVKVADQSSEVVNVFTVHSKAQSMRTLVLPPWDTLNNTADDIFHNDVFRWLERKGVGWSMIDVKSEGRSFVNCITTALFPLTSPMIEAICDEHNSRGPPDFSFFFCVYASSY
jgi:hypothetical protein